jgi:hypothetical protein
MAQWDTDHFGDDLRDEPYPAETPAHCCTICSAEPLCMAWSFVINQKSCWLKSWVGTGRRHNQCCVSGDRVKHATELPPGLQEKAQALAQRLDQAAMAQAQAHDQTRTELETTEQLPLPTPPNHAGEVTPAPNLQLGPEPSGAEPVEEQPALQVSAGGPDPAPQLVVPAAALAAVKASAEPNQVLNAQQATDAEMQAKVETKAELQAQAADTWSVADATAGDSLGIPGLCRVAWAVIHTPLEKA